MKLVEYVLWCVVAALIGLFAGKELHSDEQKMADEVTRNGN